MFKTVGLQIVMWLVFVKLLLLLKSNVRVIKLAIAVWMLKINTVYNFKEEMEILLAS